MQTPARKYFERLAETFIGHRVTPLQMWLFFDVRDAGPQTDAELELKTGISKHTARTVFCRLSQFGLAKRERIANPKTGNIGVHNIITDAGRELLAEIEGE